MTPSLIVARDRASHKKTLSVEILRVKVMGLYKRYS